MTTPRYKDNDIASAIFLDGVAPPSVVEQLPVQLCWPEPTHDLEMPEGATYGWAKHMAIALQAPIGWAYCSLLAMHASHGVNLTSDEPNPRPTLYVCLVAAPEIGKSVTMSRARQALLGTEMNIEYSTPSSSEGLMAIYPRFTDKTRETENPLKASLLLCDEMGDLLKRTQYQGSTLASTLNSLFYQDITGAASTKGMREAHVRLSILGALPAETIEDFRDVWGQATTTGLHSRMIICPGPPAWKWDHRLQIRGEYRAALQGVCISDSAYEVYEAWRNAAPKRGRLSEIGQRVAVLSASLNGEILVTEQCMNAAMAFAEWQELVRTPYAPSLAQNEDARVTDAILRAVDSECRYKAGEFKGQPMYVKWRDLYRAHAWHRLGGATVRRVRDALMADGIIEGEMEKAMDPESGREVGPPKWTGRVRPIDDEENK
jgi:hypothetical protein